MVRLVKQLVYEEIEVNFEGKRFNGRRAIEGKTKLKQYVIHNDFCIVDPQTYKLADKDGSMLVFSQQLLLELVTGRTLSAQPKEKYGL